MVTKVREQWLIAWEKMDRSGLLYFKRYCAALIYIVIIISIATMGYSARNRQEDVPFEHVLKSNFLLHEKLSKVTEALNIAESKNTEYQETIRALRENIKQHAEFMKGYDDDNNRMKETLKTLTNTFDDYAQLQQNKRKLHQENFILTIQIKEYKTELGKLKQDISSSRPKDGICSVDKTERNDIDHIAEVSVATINTTDNEETENYQKEEKKIGEIETNIIKEKINDRSNENDSVYAEDRMSVSDISTDSMNQDLNIQGTKEESGESDYISEDTASDFDSSSNMSDSSVSKVSSGNMTIPYDSVILEYIFQSDEARDFIRNECCEYNKVEVKKEILNFIDQPHRVYVRSKSQERGKELR